MYMTHPRKGFESGTYGASSYGFGLSRTTVRMYSTLHGPAAQVPLQNLFLDGAQPHHGPDAKDALPHVRGERAAVSGRGEDRGRFPAHRWDARDAHKHVSARVAARVSP